MRKEPYSVGSIIHVIKRGARGAEIVRDSADKWRFLRMLYLLNDCYFDKNWIYGAKDKPLFHRPNHWPDRDQLVEVLAYTLMPNHFHLILRETHEGGVSKFMQRLGQSMTNYVNERYQEQGSLFQGAFQSRTVETDEYLRYVAAYVMAKNTLELFPEGGIHGAQRDFETAWEWAIHYEFSSLGEYMNTRDQSPILTTALISDLFTPAELTKFSKDLILSERYLLDSNKLE